MEILSGKQEEIEKTEWWCWRHLDPPLTSEGSPPCAKRFQHGEEFAGCASMNSLMILYEYANNRFNDSWSFDIFWYYDSHWFPELYPVSTWFKKWSCRSCPIKSPYPIMVIMSHLSPVPEWGDVVTKETSVMSTSAHLCISRSPSFPMVAFHGWCIKSGWYG